MTYLIEAIILISEALALNLVCVAGRGFDRGHSPGPQEMLCEHDGGPHRQGLGPRKLGDACSDEIRELHEAVSSLCPSKQCPLSPEGSLSGTGSGVSISGPAVCIVPTRSPLAGLWMSRLLPDFAATNWLSINSRDSYDFMIPAMTKR